MISTLYCGEASLLSTQARHGVLPGATQASQTAFISSKVAMSESQMLALSSLDLSLPAWASRPSMIARMSLVCSVTEPAGRVARHLARQIDGVAVDHGLAHPRADVEALDAHALPRALCVA